jgi:hypothetical protein
MGRSARIKSEDRVAGRMLQRTPEARGSGAAGPAGGIEVDTG